MENTPCTLLCRKREEDPSPQNSNRERSPLQIFYIKKNHGNADLIIFSVKSCTALVTKSQINTRGRFLCCLPFFPSQMTNSHEFHSSDWRAVVTHLQMPFKNPSVQPHFQKKLMEPWVWNPNQHKAAAGIPSINPGTTSLLPKAQYQSQTPK